MDADDWINGWGSPAPQKDDWKAHWKGMPDYSIEDKTPIRTIKVSFETEEDILAFEKLMEQKIKDGVDHIWYPKASLFSYEDKRWISES